MARARTRARSKKGVRSGARRRNYGRATAGAARNAWSNELAQFLTAAARVLPPDAPMILLMADSAVGFVTAPRGRDRRRPGALMRLRPGGARIASASPLPHPDRARVRGIVRAPSTLCFSAAS